MYHFTSPASNIISSSYTSVAMSRSDSRDSATSTASTMSQNNPSIEYSVAGGWDREGRPRSASSISSTLSNTGRRSSSSSTTSWIPSPYRSCLQNACASALLSEEPSSFLSDDDLLCFSDHDDAVAQSPILAAQRELSTEEQIELLRRHRESEDLTNNLNNMRGPLAKPEAWWHQAQVQQKRPRMVRFAGEPADGKQSRRGSGSNSTKRRPVPRRS